MFRLRTKPYDDNKIMLRQVIEHDIIICTNHELHIYSADKNSVYPEYIYIYIYIYEKADSKTRQEWEYNKGVLYHVHN